MLSSRPCSGFSSDGLEADEAYFGRYAEISPRVFRLLTGLAALDLHIKTLMGAACSLKGKAPALGRNRGPLCGCTSENNTRKLNLVADAVLMRSPRRQFR